MNITKCILAIARPQQRPINCDVTFRLANYALQVLHDKKNVLDVPTWSHLLRILLGVSDRLLVPVQGNNGLGDRLQLDLVHLIVGA